MEDTLARLQKCLMKEVALLRDFAAVLEAEQAALSDHHGIDELEACTGRKTQQATMLQEASMERNGLLTRLGYAADQAGLEALCAARPDVRGLCQDLYSAVDRASQLNVQNGIMIDTFLAHNQQSLDRLRAMAGVSELYDASGKSLAQRHNKAIRAG